MFQNGKGGVLLGGGRVYSRQGQGAAEVRPAALLEGCAREGIDVAWNASEMQAGKKAGKKGTGGVKMAPILKRNAKSS